MGAVDRAVDRVGAFVADRAAAAACAAAAAAACSAAMRAFSAACHAACASTAAFSGAATPATSERRDARLTSGAVSAVPTAPVALARAARGASPAFGTAARVAFAWSTAACALVAAAARLPTYAACATTASVWRCHDGVAGGGLHGLVHPEAGLERLGLGRLGLLLGGVDATAGGHGERDAGGEADPHASDGPRRCGRAVCARRAGTARSCWCGTSTWVGTSSTTGDGCTDHRRSLARHDVEPLLGVLDHVASFARPLQPRDGAPSHLGTRSVRLEARCRFW